MGVGGWPASRGRSGRDPFAGRRCTAARMLALNAWLAARSQIGAQEQSAVEELLVVEPGDLLAIERLIDFAAQDGHKERVAELRRRKADIEKAIDDYKQLMNHPELLPLAAELARAAEAIGRRYDAKTWWRIAARREASLEHDAASHDRLARAEPPAVAAAGTLADRWVATAGLSRGSQRTAATLSVPTFVDEAARRGLAFTFDNGHSEHSPAPRDHERRRGLLDFDGDGWLDVYAIQGGPFPPPPGLASVRRPPLPQPRRRPRSTT